MDSLPSLLLDVLRDHEIVEPPLERATEAAFHLCIDPNGERAAAHCRVAWSFVHEQVLPHLRAEEEEFFPRALKLGCPPEVIYLLQQDHDGLRLLASRLSEVGFDEGSRAMSSEQALLFSRFVEATRWHASREEEMLNLVRARGAGF